jgi:thiamine-phosphate pyrophosphorylase
VFPTLYAIMDAVWLRRSELALAELLAESGVELIQYRNKQLPTRTLLQVIQGLVSKVQPRGVRLIVNDRPDVAALAGAGGVHVGQEDLPVAAARMICGPELWVGVSTHSIEQIRAAAMTTADYIAVGPVFSTATKQRPDPVVGTELLRRARGLTAKPIIAIGGITVERAEEIFRAGADCVAVAQDLLAAENPGHRAKEFLAIAARVLGAARN